MHELFANLLSKRDPLDLSRAGDLFSIPDEEIVDDLTDVVRKVTKVIFLILFYKKMSLYHILAAGNFNNRFTASIFRNNK